MRLEQKGRGRALHAVWSTSDARCWRTWTSTCPPTSPRSLPLVAPLISGHSDVAIGTRLGRGARVVRGPKREIISRCYNLILKSTLAARFSDAQCGFKAIRADVAQRLLPHVDDTGWFFDTELLVLAERSGLRIHEVPVDWVDDPDSRVDIVDDRDRRPQGHRPAAARLRDGLDTGANACGAARFVHEPRPRRDRCCARSVRFASVGIASTVAYLLLFMLLHGWLGAQAANLVALLVTAIGNTAANRRFTFGVARPHGVARHHVEGLIVFGIALAITSGALAALHAVVARARTIVDATVLVAANLLATAVRFVLLRGWVFHPRRNRLIDTETRRNPTDDDHC